MVTIEQLREAAEKAGMAKFWCIADPDKPRTDMVLVGADFLERIHAQLVKNERPDRSPDHLPEVR